MPPAYTASLASKTPGPNLKSAARFLRKSPGFSLTVILTLALGIGANSAVFSAIDAILLRPLPFPNANELVVLHQYNHTRKNPNGLLAPVRLEEWNRQNSTFQAIAGWYTENVSEMFRRSCRSVFCAPTLRRGFSRCCGVASRIGPRFHAGGSAFWRSGSRPDQRPAVAAPLSRRPAGRGQNAARRYLGASDCRRDAARLPIPEQRRGSLASRTHGCALRAGSNSPPGSPPSGVSSPA